jgi:hypothetical protein
MDPAEHKVEERLSCGNSRLERRLFVLVPAVIIGASSISGQGTNADSEHFENRT